MTEPTVSAPEQGGAAVDPGDSPLNPDEEIAEIEKLLAAEPDDFQARCRLGELYFSKGRMDDALVEVEPALRRIVGVEQQRIVSARAYPSIPSSAEIDATGAGDTMLAGLVAARLAAGRPETSRGRDLHLGALAASLLVEGPGMTSVPRLRQVSERVGQGA